MKQGFLQDSDFQEASIVYANDKNIRFGGSSGGAISALTKYFFDYGRIDSGISFRQKKIFFEPIVIKSFSEYNLSGSIYHEINLIKFVQDNIRVLGDRPLIVCPPCQALPIRKILKKNNKKPMIISFVCSAQMKKDATLFLLDYLKIRREQVSGFQYRGNGWPSGIQIKTRDKIIKIPNLFSVWTDIFHSGIFTLDKCFSCVSTFSDSADIVAADPWLKRYIDSEKLGCTVLFSNTEKGRQSVDQAIGRGYLFVNEIVKKSEIIDSQRFTLEKKYVYVKHKKSIAIVLKIIRSRLYINLFFRRFHSIHTKLFLSFVKYLYEKEKNKNINNKFAL